MNIRIVAVGKIKEKYIQEGIKEFTKRLSRYCSLDIIEIDDEKAPENLSEKEMEIVKTKEGERILGKIPQNSFVIVLAIEGKQLSSEELSEKMADLMINGINDITFVIGGSLGLSIDVMNRSNFKLSFSKMTFPHQLMRLILLEQIYRGWRIMKGEPYHK
ncbi:23S rRNA (pseudouridine(1915)-N(3))-methyltransferase RlmH [Tissierella sp. P1]|jgi:23S rRNA (pseudouridine1915-N3)-methyltransferase|uniref:23S rRNA (pseudouridine(1915)-N(3))-methyltransferase RlmH n=1 Tax=Tissierella TaxID=41273 RepID=UPI000BA006F3|nr:23S rRNA (pseudouridine(1915)-N(3))-methyltransferase RlmH [Tissierella sp. P1]MDU5082886.1 23S rRNA (pseudouridine(1915)-N(3))-methyltransferase RlmH [Bacillota bacterium]OZV10837.1 23S rRNA (pseudouridine(1915)-N(3))-methyltransferase RlmH [Tissierella sp. P1]